MNGEFVMHQDIGVGLGMAGGDVVDDAGGAAPGPSGGVGGGCGRRPQGPVRVVGASPVETQTGRGRDPTVYTPIPGGPATTIRDSSECTASCCIETLHCTDA